MPDKPLPTPFSKPSAAQQQKGDGRTRYNAGDVIFLQNDPGGDLFFIEDGSVEIFTTKESETIILSEMGPGEIIGVMTCMTSEPRMASARAKTSVLCKKVPHDSIRKVIAALPNWMKIVLKEFTIRLTQMNRSYSDAVMKIKRLEQTQISNVYLGALIASSFATLAEFMNKQTDVAKIVVVEEVLQKLEFCLNMRKEDIDRIWVVLLEAGLIKLEVEPDKKRTVTRLENAQKLMHFAAFVRDSKVGQTKRFVRAKFTNKETRVLSALVKFAARLDMDLEKSCRLPMKEVEKSLERSTGVKFEVDALQKGIELKLLAIEGEEDKAHIVMKPSHLGRTVACIEAVRRLSSADEHREAKRKKEPEEDAA